MQTKKQFIIAQLIIDNRVNTTVNGQLYIVNFIMSIKATKLVLMKKLFAVLLFGIGLPISLYAQPSFQLDSGTGAYTNAETFCVTVETQDFTDILVMQYTITWDVEAVNFLTVEDFNLSGLGVENFDITNVQDGFISLDWEGPSGNGVTVDDNSPLFDICFETGDDCGSESVVEINQASVFITRPNASTRNIGIFPDGMTDANISVAGVPVTISAEQLTPCPEEFFCIAVTADFFERVESFQYTMEWDTSIVSFVSIEPSTSFPFMGPSVFNVNQSDAGRIGVSWFQSGQPNGVTVEPGEKMYDICFQVQGVSNEVTPIQFSGAIVPIEIATAAEGVSPCAQLNDGRARVCSEDGAITAKSSTEVVDPGAQVCVDVTIDARGIQAIDALNFTLAWDADTLQFDSIRNISLPGLSIDDFNLAPTANGALILNWEGEPVGIPQETRIFQVCFTAIGPGGSSSQVAFRPFPVAPFVSTTLSGDDDAGLNIRSGSVFIRPPESLNLSITNATPSPGETVCVDILADDFTDITRLQASMSWETRSIEFVGIENINVPGMTLGDFTTDDAENGVLVLRWESNNFAGETLENGERLFSLCFYVRDDAPLGTCAPVFFTDIPATLEAFSTNSNNLPLNVSSQGNELCIFDPGGFTVSVSDGLSADPDSTVCIPVTVDNFTDLTSIQFSVNWNPANFQFSDILDSGAFPDAAVYDTTQANLGIVTVSWESSMTSGASLANGTPLFDLCLRAVGERLSCTRIDITSVPLPLEVFSAVEEGVNVSLNPINGIVCINDALIIEEVILNGPTCAADGDGSIELVISGGDGEYDYFWGSTPPQFSPIADGLSAGEYCVTVSNGTLVTNDCFLLEPANPTPTANAGQDQNISCDGNSVNLNGTRSSVGDSISYRWTFIDDGNGSANVFQATQQSSFAFVLAGDSVQFQLVVTDNSNGCTAVDTVKVTKTEDPFIDAGQDLVFTCETDELTLDASATEQGPNITYLWTTLDGEFLTEVDTAITNLTPTITEGGTYILRLEHSGGCIVNDTVLVDDIRNTSSLIAEAGNSRLFDCDTESLTLGDSLTTASPNVVYEWRTVDGRLSPAFVNTQFTEALSAGTYELVVTDIQTACVVRDTVEVLPNENTPMVTAGFIDFLSCRTTEVPLNINVENTTDFTTLWTMEDGIFPADQVNEITPVVTQPGTYEVIVTDATTGCPMVLGGIVVTEDFTEPVAEAGVTTVLGCAPGAEVQLSVEGSSPDSLATYFWEDANNEFSGILSGQNSALPTVVQTGTYVLTVTQTSTGCTAVDSVMVIPTEDIPEIVVAAYDELPCSGGEITLDATASSVGDFLWSQVSGEPTVIGGAGTPTAFINTAGIYQLRLENEEGCIATQEFEVIQGDTSAISLTIDISSQELTCDNPTSTITINAEWSGDNPDFNYRFIPRQDSPVLPDESEVTLTIAGIYDVEVTENNSMCTRTELVAVGQNLEVGEVVFETDSYELGCDGTPVIPETDGIQLGFNETLAWLDAAGDSVATVANLEILEVGDYTLVITNPSNGCTSDAMISVVSASNIVATIEPADILTCANTQITLNAFGSTTGENITYAWEGPSFFAGQDTETAIVDAAGTYSLTVTNTATSCDAVTEITVEENVTEPMLVLAETIDLGCETTAVVGGDGIEMGDNITYAWTDTSGTALGSEVELQVLSAGTYTLVVTDSDNGCEASASIAVTQNIDLEDASVGADQMLCDPTTSLMANLPEGSTGIWTELDGGMILSSTDPNTMVDEMNAGTNRFVWTLSSADCPDYSADTLAIFVEGAPDSRNDFIGLDLTEGESVPIRLIANDDLTGTPEWSITISTPPSIGTVDSVSNGQLNYTIGELVFANTEDSFEYTICNDNCPDLCSTALVRVLLEADPNTRTATYNAITPNGDGLNDEFVFDILSAGADKFPNNELIIFNRWGDIVFSQDSYDNTWRGQAQNGQDLPEGTYYFILRLNLGNGDVLRGDVTIIR